MKNDNIKIALVDDEILFLEGLILLFSTQKNIDVISALDNGHAFLDKLASSNPSIALVDIQMRPMDGFELVERIKEIRPELKIIVLSTHYRKNVVGHMIKLGVSAFIPKKANKELLVRAIESVHEFGVYFTAEDHKLLASYMNSKASKPTLSRVEELTDREVEVLKLICKEQTNQEIADSLFLSKRTIESHRQRILDKVGAKNTVGLVVYAIANDLYALPQHAHSV